jgi:DNA invertase Pin-like site-specific DNA recombinase
MIAAIYCRLSKEDEDKNLESESIQNQKSLLIKYAVEKGWDIYNIYCDEDYSGIDRERPAFRQLIAEAKQGKFEIVLVKTQSRFTRDMELVERYIHGKFLEWGIRFVSIVDNVDTAIKGNKKARQINGLINEWYLEDLSENIRTVFDYKRKSGQYIGGFPLYGYQKSPVDKHKLIIDPTAAEVVKKIFGLYLSGNGKQRIAHLLNEAGIPNPTRYKQLKGLSYVNGSQTNDLGLWNRTTVGRILQERMYTGDLVQGRRKKASYKSKLLICVPEEDWIIVSDAHEPIIDKATFDTVNRLLREHTKSSGLGRVHLLAGKVKCMDCGSAMFKTSNRYKGKRRVYLQCRLYTTDKNCCKSHSIRLDQLEEQVLIWLRQYIGQYYDRDLAQKLTFDSNIKKKTAAIKNELESLNAKIKRQNKAIWDLYLDKSQGLVEVSQFADLNNSYIIEKNMLEKQVMALTHELTEIDTKGNEEALQAKIKNWLDIGTLTRELVAIFVDTVEIGDRNPKTKKQTIRINWLI